MSLNHLVIAGNLTRDPALRFFANQSTVADFGLAHNRRYKTAAGEAREEVVFLDCTAWGKTADLIAKHFTKGKAIIVEGHLKQDAWTDRDSGAKRTKIVLVVDEFHFVNDGKGPHTTSDQAPVPAEGHPASDPDPRGSANTRPCPASVPPPPAQPAGHIHAADDQDPPF